MAGSGHRPANRPGRWGTVARIEGDRWVNLGEAALWTGVANRSDELSGLKFGFPQMQLLPGGDVLLVFWCVEDAVTNIRWLRLRIG